ATSTDSPRTVAIRSRISRRTSAFARKLRELSAAFAPARSVRNGHGGGARISAHGRDRATEDAPGVDALHEKTRDASAAGFGLPMKARSVIVAFQQLGIVVRAQQLVELFGICQLHHEQPTVA